MTQTIAPGIPEARMRVEWRVFVTCWLVYTALWTPFIVREHFPAIALSESGALNVQIYNGWIDDIFAGPRGRAFINNNPGASLTGAIPLVLLRPLLARVDAWNRQLPRPTIKATDSELFWRTLQEGRAYYFLLVAFLTVALVMAPATAGTAAYLCSRVIQAGVPPLHAAAAALLYGIATPVLFRTGHLNHNLLAGDAGITALLLLWDPRRRAPSTRRAAIAGLLAGYAVLCDYSGIVVLLVTAVYLRLSTAGAADGRGWRKIAAFAMGVIPPLAILAIYQMWAFGSFYRPSQHFMPPTAPTSHGYRGFDWPSLSLLWANFFDPRFGLFAYCPALILAFAAPFVRVRHRIPPRETWILLLYFALFVAFCAANQYSWLQPLTGFRYLAPVVPGLALLAMQAAQALPALPRWILAAAAMIQSLLLSAAHENDVRLAFSTLWNRRFALLWMIRLQIAGFAITPVMAFALFLSLALLVAGIWLAPARRSARNSSMHANPK